MALSNNDWVISIKSKLEEEEVMPSNNNNNNNNNTKRCIYRVPGWLKEHVCDGNDQTPYVPEIISFGPYHRGEEWLAETEKHKWRCLKKMLQRVEQDVDVYLVEMKKLEAEVRACYQEPVILDSNAFVEMLVLDGCFMLEFLRVHKLGLMELEYNFDDPLFSKSTITHVIARDMIKLENQLPIIVLKRLLEIQYGESISDDTLIPKLVLRALSSIWVTNEIPKKKKLKYMRKAVVSNPENKLLHYLDIFRSGLLYQPPSTSEVEEQVVDTSPRRNLSSSTRSLGRVSSRTVLDQEKLHDPEMGRPPVASSGSRLTQNGSRTLGSYLQFDAETDNSESNVTNSRLDEPQEQQLGLAVELESFNNHVPNHISSLRLDAPKENFIDPNNDSQSFEDHVSSSSSEDEFEEQNSETRKNSRKMSYLDHVIDRAMICGWRPPRPYYEKLRNNSALMVYCVEDLREAGVKFKSRNCQSFWDLKFDKKNGLLEIPPIKIDDATKTVFLNLIAYEQCHFRDFTDMRITDYVAFMDNLVNSAADVSHLHHVGIIVHQLGSDVEVADLFNRFVKKAFVNWKDGKLKKLYEEMNRYCTHKRHKWRASWRNDYMKNPWVIISIVAAFILFGATLLQTVYTVFPYYVPGKS
ncbi:hypothetical protein KSS87_008193 [Heliosperma pusillum]|nr:hypothetical protein KSS87_008193 [Heliosperma pusillum]